MGAAATLVGASLPVVLRDFNWSYTVASLLLAGNALGYFVSSVLSGWLLSYLGARRILSLGLTIQAIGLLSFGLKGHWVLNLALLCFIGVGQGMLEVASNWVVIQMEDRGKSRLMNLMHAAFTIGAVLAPLIASYGLERAGNWRVGFIVCGLLSAFVAVLVVCFTLPSLQSSKVGQRQGKFVRDPFVALSALAILLYVGIEMGFSSWIGEYLVVSYRETVGTAARSVSLFWTGILVGRLAFGFWYHGREQGRILLIFCLLNVLGVLGVILSASPAYAFLAILLAGVGQSVIYPMVMVLVGRYCVVEKGLAVGIVASGGGVGAFVFPLVFGGLAERLSIKAGFSFFAVMSICLALVCLSIFRQSKSA